MNNKFAVISGIGPGATGVGRLIEELEDKADTFNAYDTISFDKPFRDEFVDEVIQLRDEVLLLIHPQTIGFDLFLHLVKYNNVFIYVMDNSFFCMRSYNHLDSESHECLRCIHHGLEAALENGCEPFPIRFSVEENIKFISELRTMKDRISFLAQNHGQKEMVHAFYGDVNCEVVGLKTSDMDIPPPPSSGSPYLWDCVFHGATEPAKGVGFCLELARRMPETSFFIPADREECATKLGIELAPECFENVTFKACRWDSGLREALLAARVALNLSIWSASIEGALVKSMLYTGCVAVNTPSHSFALEIPDYNVIKLCSQKPDEGAKILTNVLENGHLFETIRNNGRTWATSFVKKSRAISRIVRHVSKCLPHGSKTKRFTAVLDAYKKKEHQLEMFKKMASFDSVFSAELIEFVIRSEDVSVTLFGAGSGGFKVKTFLDECSEKLDNNFVIKGLSDNNQALWGTIRHGLKVMKPGQRLSDADYILLSSTWGPEIRKQLLNLGIDKGRILLCF